MKEISRISRCVAPYYVQFEVTSRCNNHCFFCYNCIGDVGRDELSCTEIKRIISEMADAGVFKINFNGGEPLIRKDFFDFASYAAEKKFQLHMNTNATLMTREKAQKIAELMPSVCISLLSPNSEEHDRMSGRSGAFNEVLRGMDFLAEAGVNFEVNICTTKENFEKIEQIAEIAAAHGCNTICSTRYILSDVSQKHLLLDSQDTVRLIHILLNIKDTVKGIQQVVLPGPVPFCEIPESEKNNLRLLNIPCQFGYGLCRISPTGKITPCPISDDVLADLRQVSFQEAWGSGAWGKYEKLCHIPANCRKCEDFLECKCGCIVYDQCLLSNGITPDTKKWGK